VAGPVSPDVLVYVCKNAFPQGERLPPQWEQDGLRVLVRTVPCSGKVDGQYMFHALESGAAGLCVVTCPKGECKLAQGNYRAEIRFRTIQRLLTEIGLEPERARLLHCSPNDAAGHLGDLVRAVVTDFRALGESPIRGGHTIKHSSV
jgi:F420-non-reducing hydrogenase iron-sulfur subunit